MLKLTLDLIMLLHTVRALFRAKDQFLRFLELQNILLSARFMLIMLILLVAFELANRSTPEKNYTTYVHMQLLHHSFMLPLTTCTEEWFIGLAGLAEQANWSRKSGICF